MAEAEAEVDEEERAQVQTETLKNLFVLYFSILKFPGKSALLPAALEGLCHFTHLINIDFFRDLLQVLRQIIADGKAEEDDDLDPVGQTQRIRIRMLGIVAAFDLLSGQGEALNIDLGDFVDELYALLRPLSLDTGVEDPPLLTAATAAAAAMQKKAGSARATSERQPAHTLSTSALLFRCLEAIFFPRWGRTPPLRAAAFGKRLCECALSFPPATARETLSFVRRLASKEPKLANLLDTEERTFDGVYRPEIDDPQLSNPFTSSLYELETLAQRHWEHKVRGEAKRLRDAHFV
jgi:nucleolar complex protein 3